MCLRALELCVRVISIPQSQMVCSCTVHVGVFPIVHWVDMDLLFSLPRLRKFCLITYCPTHVV